MFDFGSLKGVVFNTVDHLNALANEMSAARKRPDLKEITEELTSANEALDETIKESQVSEKARQALLGLQKDLRAEVLRQISQKLLLLDSPLLKVQVGTAQAQQRRFSKELKKFEERLAYVLKKLKKSRGGEAAPVEQDETR